MLRHLNLMTHLAFKCSCNVLSFKVFVKNAQTIENHQLLPLHSFVVPCGFPSSADDHLEDNIDLVAHLVSRPSATFVMQVSGDSMEGAGSSQEITL